MTLTKRRLVRVVVVYLIAMPVVCVVTGATWGATAGLLGRLKLAGDKEYQQRLRTFMEERGLDADQFTSSSRSWYEQLSEEDRKRVMRFVEEIVADINWSYVALFVSVVVFALVGFLSGLFARSWIFVGIVPLLSFLFGNPVVSFALGQDLSLIQKVIIVVLGQFAICYLFAYWGAGIGLKREQRKMLTVEQSGAQ